METTALLFSLLRCAVCGEELNEEAQKACTSQEELAKVYTLAKKHDMAHLAAHALEKLDLPECEAVVKLREAKSVAIYRYLRLDHEFEKICGILEEGKVPFMPLKGSVLRDCYPEPWMRSSCDIDILVKPENLWDAVMLLEKEGYQRKGKSHHDVSLYAVNGVHLELHYELIEETDPVPVKRFLNTVWECAEQKVGTEQQYLMSDGMFYLYHIAHMASHFLRGGCGIRTCLDIWILNHRVPGDLVGREQILNQSGLQAFAVAAEKLSEYWFSGVPTDEDTVCFGDCVMRGGIYGNRDNGAAVKRAAETKLHIPFHRLVIPYEDLRYYYSELDRKPWLMPVCQVLRWFRIAGILRNQLRRHADARKVSDRTEARLQQLLHYLGLHTQ